MELTMGFGPEDNLDRGSFLKFCKEAGFTSIETYVTWKNFEPKPGKFDWNMYDEQVELFQEYGLKWVPFFIMGPWYATPSWFQESTQSAGYVCLEHGKENGVQSLWNPALPQHIDRCLAEFAQHFLSSEPQRIESVLLGITGDYGEAIYPVYGNWPDNYHTHPGYWCADPGAKQDLREKLKAKYGEIENLNIAWSTSFKDFAEIEPFLDENRPNPQAWLDLNHWYLNAMTHWADLWLELARKHMPQSQLYLCVGGEGVARTGASFSALTEVAAKHKAGIRITNDTEGFARNFIYSRGIGSAARFYGTFFGIEPSGNVSPKSVVGRMFNVASQGARQLHDYPGNLYDFAFRQPKEEAFSLFGGSHPDLKSYHPRIGWAALIPQDEWTLRGSLGRYGYNQKIEWGFYPELHQRLTRLRNLVDYDFLDEVLIKAGALPNYSFLLFPDGDFYDQEVIAKILEWLLQGGALFLLPNSNSESYMPGLRKALQEKIGSMKGLVIPLSQEKWWAELAGKLAELGFAEELSPLWQADGIYMSKLEEGILVYNETDETVSLEVGGVSFELAGNSFRLIVD